VPWISPLASTVIENVPFIIIRSAVWPDQVPVSDPWKTLGVGVWVLVVGVEVEVIVDVVVDVIVDVVVEVIVDVGFVVVEVSVLPGLGHPRTTKIITIMAAITRIPINKMRRLRFIKKSSIGVCRHH
jgi:hypothetical protein